MTEHAIDCDLGEDCQCGAEEVEEHVAPAAAEAETVTPWEPPPKVQCVGIKKDGNRCKAWSVRGRDQCAGHLGLGISSDPKGYSKLGSARSVEARQRRVELRKMGLLERMASEVEERAGEIVGAFLTAGLGEKGDWRALQALLERVYGKPTERVEQVGESVDLEHLTPAERQALRAQLLDQFPQLRQAG